MAKKKTVTVSEPRRRSRRRFAYAALLSILVVTYWCLFTIPIERLKALNEIITWFYFIMGSIIGSYIGFATVYDMKKNLHK